MTKKTVWLCISPELKLPIDAVTGTHVVYGRKRKGKTYKAKVLAEEMLEHGQQIVVIDPTDAWWGLRSSADGTSAGYKPTIFGGRHADLPLDAAAGEEYADAIAEDDFSAIFSLKGMTRANEQRFCYLFLERLYRRNPQKPLHIFMDEADIYAPQSPFGEEARTLGATQNMVRRGGLDGLGMTLITQRPAVLAKSVSSQCDTLISVGLNDPRDLDAVKDWVNANFEDRELAKRLMIDIPQLGRPENRGLAWVLSPDRDIKARVHFRELRTFDSGRTPKVGEKRRAPRVLSKVDLEHLGKRIAATVEQAKANDPKQLKMQVVKLTNEKLTLEAQLAAAKGAADKATGKPGKQVTIERKVIKDGQLTRIEKLIESGDKAMERWVSVTAKTIEPFEQIHQGAINMFSVLNAELGALRNAVRSAMEPPSPPAAPNGHNGRVYGRNPASTAQVNRDVAANAAAARPPASSKAIVGPDGEPFKLSPAMQRILDATALLAHLGISPSTKKQVAFYAGTSPKSSAYTNNLGALRTAQLITYPTGGTLALTDGGTKLADRSRAPQTIEEVHKLVRDLVSPACWRIVEALIASGHQAMTKGALADAAGASAASSAYTNNLGALRTLGLLDYPGPGSVVATDIMLGVS